MHAISKLIIRTEHLRLLHAGPLLVSASLSRRYHVVGGRKAVRSVTRSCVTCRRRSPRPQPPLMGQLPRERITPDSVFNQVGIDYAGPILIKHGYVRRPTIIKAYICIFVSLSVKAVHIEAVSDLTTEAFIACLRHFISRRGKPSLIWSDHGTNFAGASRQLKELYEFLKQSSTEESVMKFSADQQIVWEFIPERAPHFGGLWEAAVKGCKKHLSHIVGNTKLTFEELTTILSQIEACLNSRPLTPLPYGDDKGLEVLTPGHFLIGRPLEALPDRNTAIPHSLSGLKRWQLCQTLTNHFWTRWSTEYLSTPQKMTKWQKRHSNISVGDIVIVCEKGTAPTQWPLARVIETFTGADGFVRVIKVKTQAGAYVRPIHKIAPLLSSDI